MFKTKFLLLLIAPAFMFSLIGLLSMKEQSPLSVHRSIVQAEPAPIILPQPIALVTQTPEQISEPAAAQSATTPTPAPARTVSRPSNTVTYPKTVTTAITKTEPAAVACAGSFTQEFLCLLNQYRASKSLGQLSYSSSLAAVALGHSQWMQTTGTFSHTGEGGSRLGDRCRTAGITCRGETLALGATSPQNLLNMWKASSSHNAILLGPYSTVGLGIAGSYYTALFN